MSAIVVFLLAVLWVACGILAYGLFKNVIVSDRWETTKQGVTTGVIDEVALCGLMLLGPAYLLATLLSCFISGRWGFCWRVPVAIPSPPTEQPVAPTVPTTNLPSGELKKS